MPTPTKRTNSKGFKKETSTKILNVDLRNCEASPELEREDYGDLSEMTNSINKNGIIQVLWGKRDRANPKRFIIWDGGRRIKASQPLIKKGKLITADIRLIPPGMSMEQMYALQIVLNRGKRYEDFENAKVVKKLIEVYGRKPIEIQKEYKWTPQYVESLLIFNKATNGIQKLVRQGRLSLTFLMELYKKNGCDFANVETIIKLADPLPKKSELKTLSEKKSDNTIPFPPEPPIAENENTEDEDLDEDEVEEQHELFEKAAITVITEQIASEEFLEKKLMTITTRESYQLIEQLIKAKVIAPFDETNKYGERGEYEVLFRNLDDWEKANLLPEQRSTNEFPEAPVAWSAPKDNEPQRKPKREKSTRITQKHVDQALKKVNSFSELWKFMEDNKQLQHEMTVTGQALWTFAEGLRENHFTAEHFPNLFYGEKSA